MKDDRLYLHHMLERCAGSHEAAAGRAIDQKTGKRSRRSVRDIAGPAFGDNVLDWAAEATLGTKWAA